LPCTWPGRRASSLGRDAAKKRKIPVDFSLEWAYTENNRRNNPDAKIGSTWETALNIMARALCRVPFCHLFSV
jgi:hypothetical protein